MMLATIALICAFAQAPIAGAGAVVSGQVLDEHTRAPLPGATVTLVPPLEQARLDPSAFRTLSVTTDANGRFVFEGVSPDRYTIRAQKAGFAARLDAPNVPPLTLRAGSRIDAVELLLQMGGVIKGRVVDPAGTPVAGASVWAHRALDSTQAQANPRFPTPASTYAATNALGEFRLDELLPGAYYLRLMPPSASKSAPVAADVTTTLIRTYYPDSVDPDEALPVAVAAGEFLDVGALAMRTANAFRVVGTIVDERGRGVVNVMVRMVPATAPPGALPMSAVHQTRSAADGAFVLDRVVAGDYTIVAVPPLVLAREGRAPTDPSSESMSFVLGGSRPESIRGSVWTESKNGITVQDRDELATQQRLVISDDAVPGLHLVVRLPAP